jgi:hypothetical protein
MGIMKMFKEGSAFWGIFLIGVKSVCHPERSRRNFAVCIHFDCAQCDKGLAQCDKGLAQCDKGLASATQT